MKKIYNNSPIYKFIPCTSKGTYGGIYRIKDDLCIKLFEYNLEKLYKVDPEVLSIIKNLKLSNFYEIYDLLYDDNERFMGYVMKYYKKEDIDLLTMPVESILKIVRNLYKSIKILSKNKITIRDMRCYNAIINRNNIIVIDVDGYFLDKSISEKELLHDNIKYLYYLLDEIFHLSIKNYYRDMDEEYYDITEDLCGTIEETKDIKTFCSSLEGCENMMGYIRKKTR